MYKSISQEELNTQLIKDVECGYLIHIEKRITDGAKVDVKDSGGYSLLHISAKKGYVEVSEFLIDMGINVNTSGPNGLTPFDLAIKYDRAEVVKMLIERGGGVDFITAITKGRVE